MKSSLSPIPPTTNRGVKTQKPSEKQGGPAIATTIDWLTCTSQVERVGMGWFDIWYGLAQRNLLEFGKPWVWMGYEGSQTEGARWGRGPQGFIFVVSGFRANEVWQKLEPGFISVTRLDIATTMDVSPHSSEGLVKGHYDALPAELKTGLRKYSLVQNLRGGQTLYVGSRQSNAFGRVYDKSAEQKQAPGLRFRYEVVLRKPLATPVVKQLHSLLSKPGGVADAMKHARVLVYDWFSGRAVNPHFQREMDDAGELVLETEIAETTLERKLKWLSRQVSPTVRKLLAAGRDHETLEALSLEAFLGAQDIDFPEW